MARLALALAFTTHPKRLGRRQTTGGGVLHHQHRLHGSRILVGKDLEVKHIGAEAILKSRANLVVLPAQVSSSPTGRKL
jgi:hypothetical protein